MRRAISWILIICGIGCIGFGIWGLSTPIAVNAQDELPEALQDADYEGSDNCADCHRNLVRSMAESAHGLALQDTGRDKDPILADFSQSESLRLITIPGEDAPRAFTEDDIEYVIGAGRYVQRYVAEIDDQYFVLPAEWDVVNSVWRPYQLAETFPDPAYDFVANCAYCHVTGLNVERARWEDEGVMCEACHGPGSVHIELAEDAGRRASDEEFAEIHAAIIVSPDAQMCGQCHSMGSTPYPIDYQPGGVLVHEGFTLASEDNSSVWYGSGHARVSNMQYNEWLNSAHATSLETMLGSESAQDGCLTCHSGDTAFTARILEVYDDGDLSGVPPEMPTISTAAYAITCQVCHSPHAAEDEEFNLTSEPYAMCTACHQNTDLMPPLHHPVKEMFEGERWHERKSGLPDDIER